MIKVGRGVIGREIIGSLYAHPILILYSSYTHPIFILYSSYINPLGWVVNTRLDGGQF